jgi:hypothetical protein
MEAILDDYHNTMLIICNADQHQRLAVGDAGRERIDVLDGVEPVAAAKRRRQRLHPPADAAKNAADEQENRRAKQVDEFPESVAETQLNGKLRLPIFCEAEMCCLCRFCWRFCQS